MDRKKVWWTDDPEIAKWAEDHELNEMVEGDLLDRDDKAYYKTRTGWFVLDKKKNADVIENFREKKAGVSVEG